MPSDREDLDRIEQVAVDRLVVADGLGERHVDEFVVLDADHDVALTLQQGVDGRFAHPAGQNPVARRGRTSPLDVAQDGDAYVVLGIFVFHAFGQSHRAARELAFGYQHDTAVFRLAETVLDQFGDRASLSDWAAQHAATLVAYQIVGGDTDGNLNPQAFLTRAEMAALLYKLSNYTPPADLDPGDLVQPEKDPQPGGTADPGQAEGPGQTADPDQPEDPGQTSQPEEPAVPVEGITLDTGELTLQAGSSYHFTPTLSPEGAAGTVVWTSSVPTVAPVTSDGTITNLNTTGGQVSVTITASCGDACTSAVVLCDTAASAGTVRGAENGLNVRSGPSTSHSVVGYLREGGRVILLAPPEDGWLHVSYLTQSGQAAIGYVSLDYIVLD